MKIVKSDVTLLHQEDYSIKGIKKFIERCARLSYKSEGNITEDSYKDFVQMLINKDHTRPLEFGTVHLKMVPEDFNNFVQVTSVEGSFNGIWFKYHYHNGLYYITTNYRYYLELFNKGWDLLLMTSFTVEDNEYFPKRHTAKFIVSRGIMDEFRTHISLSSIAESTRWCNYSKGKFNNEITVILPRNLYDTPEVDVNYLTWKLSLTDAENAYMNLLNMEWTPQHARGVLPLDIKSELIMCGFEDAWDNFFYRRCALDAHPDARYIANKLKELIDNERKD